MRWAPVLRCARMAVSRACRREEALRSVAMPHTLRSKEPQVRIRAGRIARSISAIEVCGTARPHRRVRKRKTEFS
jgi:hypothetical protein